MRRKTSVIVFAPVLSETSLFSASFRSFCPRLNLLPHQRSLSVHAQISLLCFLEILAHRRRSLPAASLGSASICLLLAAQQAGLEAPCSPETPLFLPQPMASSLLSSKTGASVSSKIKHVLSNLFSYVPKCSRFVFQKPTSAPRQHHVDLSECGV